MLHLNDIRIFIALGSSAFLFSRIFLGMITDYAQFVRDSHTIKGVHFACIAAGGVAFSLLFRWWSKVYSRAFVTRVAALAMTGAFVVVAFSSSPWLTLPAYFLAGGTGSMIMAMLVLVASEYESRSQLISEMNITGSLASIVAPMAIGLALAWSEWRYALLALAGLLLGLFLLAGRIVGEVHEDKTDHLSLDVSGYRTTAWIVLMGLTMAIEWSYIFWGPAYLSSLNVPIYGSGPVLVFTAAVAAGRLIYRLMHRYVSSDFMLFSSLLGHGSLLLIFLNIGVLAKWLAVKVAAYVLIGALGITVANMFPLFTVKIMDESRAERRIVSSNILVFTGGIAALLPVVFGAVSDHMSIHGAFSMVFTVCVASVLGIGLLLMNRSGT